jgi:DNA-binding FadR family transcriptional regulator
MFDRWALIAVLAAQDAAVRATSEHVRSLRTLEDELNRQSDAHVWESVADAWRAGLFEASGNASYTETAAALWEMVTWNVDLPAILWPARARMEQAIVGIVAAVAGRAPDVAADGMRAHVEAVRAALVIE